MASLIAQMENQFMRFATFKNFPESADLFPSILSKAGFYYTGEGHTVACYSCGLRVNHWESGVHHMTLHRRLSPECQFVVNQPTGHVSAEHDDTEVVSSEEVMSQSALTRIRKTVSTGATQVVTIKDDGDAGTTADMTTTRSWHLLLGLSTRLLAPAPKGLSMFLHRLVHRVRTPMSTDSHPDR